MNELQSLILLCKHSIAPPPYCMAISCTHSMMIPNLLYASTLLCSHVMPCSTPHDDVEVLDMRPCLCHMKKKKKKNPFSNIVMHTV